MFDFLQNPWNVVFLVGSTIIVVSAIFTTVVLTKRVNVLKEEERRNRG